MTRRLQPLPTLQARLAVGIVDAAGVPSPTAARMADEVMKDIARPVAELIHAVRRAVDDNVLFDTPLEGIRPGEEIRTTELNGLVLDVAAACLTGWAAALEMAEPHARRAPLPTAEIVALPPRAPAPAITLTEEAAA